MRLAEQLILIMEWQFV